MAMLPALAMSGLLAGNRRPLPVLKVLYRNAQQIQSVGGASKTTLHALHAPSTPPWETSAVQIRDACRKVDVDRGERLLATVGGSPLDLFNALQPAIQDDLNVHRFVFAHRTYGLVGLLGKEYSYSLLRQCVRLCADHERIRIEHKQAESPIRALLPKLLDQYKLAGKSLGKRDPGDAADRCAVSRRFTTVRATGRPRRLPPRWPKVSIPRSSARRSRWRRISTFCVKAPTNGGPTATRPASIRPTRPTPGGTWSALPITATRRPG